MDEVNRGSIPSMPMTMTFFPTLRETRATLPTQYAAAPTPAAAAVAAPLSRVLRPILPGSRIDIHSTLASIEK